MDGQMREGETLLVHGGTSGIGITALAIARALGIRTLATVGNAEKMRVVEQYGAIAVNYKTDDFALAVKQHGGADGILDVVGGSYFAQNLDCLNKDGRIFLIGFMGGNIAPRSEPAQNRRQTRPHHRLHHARPQQRRKSRHRSKPARTCVAAARQPPHRQTAPAPRVPVDRSRRRPRGNG